MKSPNSVFSPAMVVIVAILSGCVSSTDDKRADGLLPTVQELDERIIDDITNKYSGSGAYGYDGISGRILEIIMIVNHEMLDKHAERCKAEPMTRHLFFYKEFDDVVRVQTAPRFVPDDRPTPPLPPSGYRYIYTRDLFPNFPAGAYGLDGCEIQFVIDKQTKEIITTNIMR